MNIIKLIDKPLIDLLIFERTKQPPGYSGYRKGKFDQQPKGRIKEIPTKISNFALLDINIKPLDQPILIILPIIPPLVVFQHDEYGMQVLML
jgi:hypothetical protein